MLGKMKNIDLRNEWKKEEDFTNWLSQEENLNILSEELKINIKLIQTEANVGSYSADILAKEDSPGGSSNIIIENQLGKTDHDHLGKCITYASGHEAKTIIWIVKEANDEHKQAIDWLNQHTDDEINFFLIKIELWQIEESKRAAKFHIIAQPNDWAKTIKKAASTGDLSELAVKEIDFWNKFVSYCEDKKTTLKLAKPQPSTPAYYSIPLGTSDRWLVMKINTYEKKLRTEIYFKEKDLFSKIKETKKEDLEKEYGKRLIWDDMPINKGSAIRDEMELKFDNLDEWDKAFEWLKTSAEKLQKISKDHLNIK